MCEAAASGDVGMVRFLVETGVAIDSGDYDGRTALHLACAGGSISTTHYLIGAMADVNAKDRWGNTPLVDALWTSNECAALLAQQCGAKLPAQHDDDDELQALYAAAMVENMYALNRKLNMRGARRRRLLLLRRDRSRELRLAFKGLMDELGLLYRASRPLFVQLRRTTDRWIETHAFQVRTRHAARARRMTGAWSCGRCTRAPRYDCAHSGARSPAYTPDARHRIPLAPVPPPPHPLPSPLLPPPLPFPTTRPSRTRSRTT
jgi:hypothetical protein